MKIIYSIIILACALTCAASEFPPMPSSPPSTNAPASRTNEQTLIEFDVVCSATNCATTNKYRVNLMWVPRPVFDLGIEMETSTDLKTWTTTNLMHRMVATDDKRFFRLPRGK
jgi:hypothetical protein